MIGGNYTDGSSSAVTRCHLVVDDAGSLTLTQTDRTDFELSDITISSRIGDTPRYLTFSDGAVFETPDNDSIDAIISRFSRRSSGIAHRFERSLPLVGLSTIVIVALTWLMIRYGIPAMSERIAFSIPEEHLELLGSDVLSSMDGHLFEPSELPESQLQHFQQIFDDLLEQTRSPAYAIEFRKSDLGPNAFAIPGGTVVFTDAIIELAESDDEIRSVMLHEIGHLERRHSLRRALQGLGLAALIAIISGDVTTSSSIVTGLPAVLVELGYSREMEEEADTYSLDWMQRIGIDPIAFSYMMMRLDPAISRRFDSCMMERLAHLYCIEQAIAENKGGRSSGYLSSHPATIERVSRFIVEPAQSTKE